MAGLDGHDDCSGVGIYLIDENEVGARIKFFTLATIAPFASVFARALNQSGSAPKAAHFFSRSASDSQARK
jgi:hypothetical protein